MKRKTLTQFTYAPARARFGASAPGIAPAPISPYCDRVAKMGKSELQLEFYALLSNASGKNFSFAQARECEFLLERLLTVSDNYEFKAQLQISLTTLRAELARLIN